VLGRYGETAMWIVVALFEGPRTAIGLLDAVRDLDGRIGPGRLLGAVARLERLGLIERADGAYRLGWRVLSSRSQTSTM
jgi:DNA-binding IclR family transcriptional regulator